MLAGSMENSLLQTLPTHEHRQSAEWLVLLECAAPQANVDHLADLLQNSFDWPALLQDAESHGVMPLLVERVMNLNPVLVPPDIRDRLRESRRVYTACSLQMTAELFRLLEHFAGVGIETLVTKGPVLAVRCYGDAGMRQYGDLDLIIREKDIRRSTEAMIALGYAPAVPLSAIQASKFPGEYAFHRRGAQLLVEFHTERTFRYHPRRLPMEELFKRRTYVASDSREIPTLAIEDELVLICVHGAKHFWEQLMWIADVAALVSKENAVNWERARAAAREVGAERILRLGLRLAMDVVKAAVPEHVEAQVRADSTPARLATQITKRLATGDPRRMGILERAAFRVKMRSGLLNGATYLMRLSLSPTEEDWVPGAETGRSWLVDALSRPLRLVRKHGRNSGT